jgi:hypothetical protein
MITVIHADGRVEELNERKPGLARLQELVGGYIERIPPALHPLTDKHVLVNEDGLMLRLPHNPKATETLGFHQMLVGTVVITELDDLT